MFDIPVTPEQIEYAKCQVESYNFGRRGRGDGSPAEQLTGLIGQTVFADLIGAPRPDGTTGFDGGFDFVLDGRKVDIKTMTRTVPVRQYYVHNFCAYQESYDVDAYIFASFNKTTNVLTICGTVDKASFFERSTRYEQGTTRTRSDGSTFVTKAPLIEIEQRQLDRVDSIEDVYDNIRDVLGRVDVETDDWVVA